MFQIIIISFKYLSLIIGIGTLLRVKVKPLWVWWLIAAALAIFLMHLYAMFPLEKFGYDYSIFWKAGCDVWAGLDPYARDRFNGHPFLNPPTALPLFALFAVLPVRLSLGLWTVGNILTSLALVGLARAALVAQAGLDKRDASEIADRWRLPPLAVAGLSICLAFSDSSLMGFYVGQLSVFVSLMLLAALVAQGRGRPVWAGVWLSLATVKVGTLVPFLLLFVRKADRWTWVALAVLILGYCSLTGRLTQLPGRLATLVDRIQELSAPGKVNDYSFQGTRNQSIIGFEALFYRLGMRDRAMIGTAHSIALVALLAWVAYVVVLGGLPRPAACGLVALCSMVFFYHRDYDTVILVLPLVYSTCRARAVAGRRHWPFTAIGLFVIAILYLNAYLLTPLTGLTRHWGAWGRLVQATVLPYATWLILVAMLTLFVAEMREKSLSRTSAS